MTETEAGVPRIRRRTVVLAGLALVGVVLVLPLLLANYEAQAAKSDLQSAKSNLSAGGFAAAQRNVAGARTHSDLADGLINSPISDLWSALPGVGGAIADARRLTSALRDTTSVAEVGIRLYPKVAGDHARLLHGTNIREKTLRKVMAGVDDAGVHLEAASASLQQIRGDTPLVGGTIRSVRDEALSQIQPVTDAYKQARPLVGQLPQVLGMDGRRRYLIAMLNPAELRYSGGAALSLAGLTADHGRLRLDKSLDLESVDPSSRYYWDKVIGNDFHKNAGMPVRNATFAPSWQVSGEELLRGVQMAFSQYYDGVVAVDVVAIADLLHVTGPVDVPGYGTLSGDNLVTKLVGSYDRYRDPVQRHELNQAIIPAFKQRLFSGGQLADKARSLTHSAAGGHFAIYMRDGAVETALQDLKMAGNLSDTQNDYLGVFTQNLNGSKVDFFQRRSLDSDVRLHSDGSADVRLTIKIHNATPPYAQPGHDPGHGYFTRVAEMSIAAFLPDGARLERAHFQGRHIPLSERRFFGRPWVTHATTVPPDGTARMKVWYQVPHAATVDGDTLAYELTFQPQGTVIPAALSVSVKLPAGYGATAVPEGWFSSGDSLQLQTDGQATVDTWRIEARQSP